MDFRETEERFSCRNFGTVACDGSLDFPICLLTRLVEDLRVGPSYERIRELGRTGNKFVISQSFDFYIHLLNVRSRPSPSLSLCLVRTTFKERLDSTTALTIPRMITTLLQSNLLHHSIVQIRDHVRLLQVGPRYDLFRQETGLHDRMFRVIRRDPSLLCEVPFVVLVFRDERRDEKKSSMLESRPPGSVVPRSHVRHFVDFDPS